MLRCVALVGLGVSEEPSIFFNNSFASCGGCDLSRTFLAHRFLPPWW
jgi:hypothetical protein